MVKLFLIYEMNHDINHSLHEEVVQRRQLWSQIREINKTLETVISGGSNYGGSNSGGSSGDFATKDLIFDDGNVEKSIVIGKNTGVDDRVNNSVVIGINASSSAIGSVAIGYKSRTEDYQAETPEEPQSPEEPEPAGDASIAIGSRAKTKGYKSIAIGYNTEAKGDSSIIIGSNVSSVNNNSIIIGNHASKSSYVYPNGIKLGNDDMTTLRIGPTSFQLSSSGMIFMKQPKLFNGLETSDEDGFTTKKYVDDKVAAAIDPPELANYFSVVDDSIVIGQNIYNDGSGNILMGNNIGSIGSNNIFLTNREASENWNLEDDNQIIIGTADSEVLYIGPNAITLASDGMTFYHRPKLASGITPSDDVDIVSKKYVDDKVAAVSGGDLIFDGGDPTKSIVIGNMASTGYVSSVVLGIGATTTPIEADTNITGFNIAIGSGATSHAQSSIAIGPAASNLATSHEEVVNNETKIIIKGKSSIAIGDYAQTANNNAIAIGDTAKAYGKESIVIGYNIHDDDDYSIIIGNNDSKTFKIGPNTLTLGVPFTGGIIFHELPKLLEVTSDTGINYREFATKKYVDDKIAAAIAAL
jgi:hypothetical protein